MVVFAVADATYKFTYINVGSPGRNCDSYILQESNLNKLLNSNTFDKVTRNMGATTVPLCLIGDSAFPLSRHIMKPYPDIQGLTEMQAFYNSKICGARRVIENAYGHLKGRFRKVFKKMEGRNSYMRQKIIACCVLHNICTQLGDMPRSEWVAVADAHINEEEDEEDTESGKELRDIIAKYMFDNYNQ